MLARNRRWTNCWPPGGLVANLDPTLDEARQIKVNDMKARCWIEIEKGITLTVGGVTYTFPTKFTDQANVHGQFSYAFRFGTAKEPYKLWCADPTGVWARRGFTATQIGDIAAAVKERVSSQQDHYEAKLNEINDPAKTVAAQIEAVTW